MRKTIVLSSIALLANNAANATQVGFVKTDDVVRSMSEFTKAEKEFSDFVAALDAEMQKKVQVMQAKVAAVKDPNTLTEAQQAEFKAMYEDLQKLEKDMAARRENKQKALLTPIQAKISAAIKTVAKEKNMDLIITAGSVEYGDPNCDITSSVITKVGGKPASASAPKTAASAAAKK